MNRTYELMFIVRPDMTEEDLDKLIATLSGVVPASGGSRAEASTRWASAVWPIPCAGSTKAFMC